jgi:prepilin signal peptidase PulO-like enzyme (type II secretory pathway)
VLRDLVPLFSFLRLKGKCRYCGEKLSWFYPLSEFLTGTLFFGMAYFLKIPQFFDLGVLSWMYFTFLFVIICVYIVITLSDAKYRIIPNKIVIPAIVFTIMFIFSRSAYYLFSLKQRLSGEGFGYYLLKAGYWDDRLVREIKDVALVLISAFLIGFFFWLLVTLTKGRGMGYGDIKLGVLIGLVNRFPVNILAVFMGFVLGAFFSLVLIVLGKKTMKDTIPFGPFLIMGSLICLVWGEQIVSFYLGTL